MLFAKKKPTHQGFCYVLHLIVAGLLLFAAIIALTGVYTAHIYPEGLVFGTTAGSLSIIAFSITLSLFMYQLKLCVTGCEACMPMTAAKKK